MSPAKLKRLESSERDISPPAKRRIPATTTAKVVANFFTPMSDKVKIPEAVTFDILHKSVLTARHGEIRERGDSPRKIAAFDFDDTLVKTASGGRFGKGAQDWQFWHASVPATLQQLHNDGYDIVVISNQAGIRLQPDPKTIKGDMKSLDNFKGKVRNVLTTLNIPVTVFAATLHDTYRKPRDGMWRLALEALGSEDDQFDREKSFFVGDAAGRVGDKSQGTKTDHSCCDRDLAANVNISFHTPEEYFLKETVRPFQRVFEPVQFLDQVQQPQDAFVKKHDVEIVVFCGSPGAGKSTFYWTYLQPLGYDRANQDILKTRDRCMQAVTNSIEEGRSIAIDNTNADVAIRGYWISLAKKMKTPIRLVHFTSPTRLCQHNDTVRALSAVMNPEKRTMLPKVAFTSFSSRYQEPSTEEGFEDILKVDFQFRGSEEQKAVWSRYWVT